MKKVVWPTRKETMQTTAAVFAFVVVMAVFLWVSDKTLEWVLYDLILGLEEDMTRASAGTSCTPIRASRSRVQRALSERIKRAGHDTTSSARSWCRPKKWSR